MTKRPRRREILALAATTAGAALAQKEAKAQAASERASRGTPSPKIKDVQVLTCSPTGVRLIVVKILTDQDGLYGYGCATFTQRADLVVAAVERYLKPFLLGKGTDRIEDIWQAAYASSYWRNGPVLNNAISGVDMALWDIKGRQAGMPVYQLLGGKCREGADCYVHASGADVQHVLDSARKHMADGYRNIRVQVGVPGMANYGAAIPGQLPAATSLALLSGPVFEPVPYMRATLKLLEACRKELGEEVGLLHDVHERVSPREAVQFAKDVEQFRLFFLEDVLSPEDNAYFRQIRTQCATPIAMGELFNSPHEWTPLIAERLIDYIRIHLSQAGGLTPSRKVAILGELFGVRTAWHGPPDLSPIGVCANLALDLTCQNFGVQEWSGFAPATKEIFLGCPEAKNGYLYASDAPGWGIEVDLKALAKYPIGTKESTERNQLNGGWGEVRRRDGTIIKQ